MEGLPGAGKTDVLSNFVARTMPLTAPIMYTSASPYGDKVHFGIFGVVLQQYLDSIRDHTSDETREGALLSELQDCEPELMHRVHLLNEILRVDNPYDSTQISIPDEKAVLKLMLHLITRMAVSSPSVLIIDDAQYLDGNSFKLLLAIACGEVQPTTTPNTIHPPPIMIIVSMRPLRLFKSTYTPISPDFDMLRSMGGIVISKIERLPAEEEDELIISILGMNVSSISDGLHKLVENRCAGIPAQIVALMKDLRNAEPPLLVYELEESLIDHASPGGIERSASIESTSLTEQIVSLDDGFDFNDAPVPTYMHKLFGYIVDKLNSCQVKHVAD
jgi:hypothetical protein